MFRNMFLLAYSKQKILCRYYARKAKNPGLDRRAALLPENANTEDYESLDDSESNFYQVHKSHKQYETEQAQHRDRLQTWIVGNKYFKTKQLNFLTWSEKEQIRYLHGYDPEEWSIDKLTESFPADRYTIAKIVKTKWQPKDNKRMERHDAVVKENWQMFRSGRIKNIDSGFAQHLNKFMQRNTSETDQLLPKSESKRLYEIRPLPEGEFSAIVTSCKKYQSKNNEDESQQALLLEEKHRPDEPYVSSSAPKQDTFLIGNIQNTQHITLTAIKQQAVNRNPSTDSMKHELPNSELDLGTSIMDRLENIHKKYATVELSDSTTNAHSAKVEDIKEFIKIPKKLHRKGATYQVDDCFYDDDGEFLYRVPGMNRKRKQ
ncbi:uncharacterized protein LOC128720701 [Anopheles nili]|uniref:uncharacterized protein LOC128720701 n=1 Tax=Anopheles nili TaxID=185578 RepID=UPI00237BA369|nr:uncharacterized protein LOC128720701 [Anopheles nili]